MPGVLLHTKDLKRIEAFSILMDSKRLKLLPSLLLRGKDIDIIQLEIIIKMCIRKNLGVNCGICILLIVSYIQALGFLTITNECTVLCLQRWHIFLSFKQHLLGFINIEKQNLYPEFCVYVHLNCDCHFDFFLAGSPIANKKLQRVCFFKLYNVLLFS